MDKLTVLSMDRIIEKKFWTKKRIWSFTILAIILLLLIYLLFIKEHHSSIRISADHISFKTVIRDNFLDYTVFTGQVVPERTIFLDAMEGGRIEEIYAEEGQLLKKGDLIVRLSNSNLQMNMMTREAELADQMNNLRNTRLLMEQNKLSLKGQLLDNEYKLIQAKRDFEQKENLYQNKMISKNEQLTALEDYRLYENKQKLLVENIKQDSLFRIVQIDQLSDSIKRMQSSLKLIREKMEGLLIKAPTDGQLTELIGEIGEAKGSGERLGTLNVINSYKLKANISEFYLNKVMAGQVAIAESDNVKIPVTLFKIHPEVKNGSFQIDFLLTDNSEKKYHIGQTFIIQLELGKAKQTIIIPKGSFYQHTGGQWIFVVSKDGKSAQKRMIKIGGQNPDYYEILEGLDIGEKIINSSYDTFGKAEIIYFK